MTGLKLEIDGGLPAKVSKNSFNKTKIFKMASLVNCGM